MEKRGETVLLVSDESPSASFCQIHTTITNLEMIPRILLYGFVASIFITSEYKII